MYIGPAITIKNEASVRQDRSTEHMRLISKIAKTGDKLAFGILFEYYAPRVKALMMRQGCGAEAAEDLMQETMLTVWQKSTQFSQSRGSVSTWIFTIARNKRIDRFRRQGTNHYVDVSELELEDETPGNDIRLEVSERDQIVREAANELPGEQKQIIELSYVEELSQSEIARKLGIPLGTVKSRTRLAYSTIRRKLEALI